MPGVFNLSAYYVTHESQYYSDPDTRSLSRPVPTLNNRRANKYFLFSRGGVCTQGFGVLRDGTTYIKCTSHVQWQSTPEPAGLGSYTMPPDDPAHREDIPFGFRDKPGPPKYEAFETAAVCSRGPIPHDQSGAVQIRIRSPNGDFATLMRGHGADNILTVTDTGGGLCPNGIDIFIGEEPSYQEDPYDDLMQNVAPSIIAFNSVTIDVRGLRW